MKWYFCLATQTFARVYPESMRGFMRKLHAQSTVELVGPPTRTVPLRVVELPEDEASKMSDFAFFAEHTLKYSKRGEEEGVLYALEYEVKSMSLDIPGIARVDRPWVDVPVGDVEISVPAERLGEVASRIEASRPKAIDLRDSKNSEYLMIPFFLRDLILDEPSRRSLLAALRAKEPEADRIAEEFDKKFDAEFPGQRAAMEGVNMGTHVIAPGQGVIPKYPDRKPN